MRYSKKLVMFLPILLLAAVASVGRQSRGNSEIERAASPEMKRLADALVGDWDGIETFNAQSPTGVGRRGTSHVRLAAGGTTLLSEGHSNGSPGELSYLIAIWWDPEAKLYRFLTCFNVSKVPCELRGTAHWEGEIFVNDYEEMVNGVKRKVRDSFTTITPDSRTLVEAVAESDGSWRPLVKSRDTRRKN